jgi:hypothetical protein
MNFTHATIFTSLCGCLTALSLAQESVPAVVATIPVGISETTPEPRPAIEMLPSDFLDCVSQQSKARWRQLYREPAASAPPTERLRVAFTLGGLLADSHLALQAGDAQQVKNINQDVLKYCSSLGLADKVSPMLMSGSKMAEGQDWTALRPKLTETYELVEKLLYDQRDEDPAELVHLGMWMRLFEITATVIQADTEMQNKTLCVGSVPLLDVLVVRYEKLSQTSRENPDIAVIGNTLSLLQKHWSGTDGRPNQELIDLTLEKVRFVNGKLTLK